VRGLPFTTSSLDYDPPLPYKKRSLFSVGRFACLARPLLALARFRTRLFQLSPGGVRRRSNLGPHFPSPLPIAH
jgi:hypothetical protein